MHSSLHRGHCRPLGRTKARAAFLAAALAGGTLVVPTVPVTAHAAEPTTFSGTVLLPDGRTPARAAVVRLARVDSTGLPVADSAFAQGVADLDGHFSTDPRESTSLLAAARANGGLLPVAVQVGKLADHGSLVPPADATRAPDVSAFAGITALRLVDGPTGPTFTMASTRPADLGIVRSSVYVTSGATIVLRPAAPIVDTLRRVMAGTGLDARTTDVIAAFTHTVEYLGSLPGWLATTVQTTHPVTVDAARVLDLVGNVVTTLRTLVDDYGARVERTTTATGGAVDATATYLTWATMTVEALRQQVVDAVGTPNVDEAVAQLWALLAPADQTVRTTRMFNDPDLVAGNENLDDPELIPPLGAELSIVPVTDAYDDVSSLTLETQPMSAAGGGGSPPPDSTQGLSDGCDVKRARLIPGSNQYGPKPSPVWGTKMRIWNKAFKCKSHDDDQYHDWWAWTWNGKTTNEDTNEYAVYLWRVKFRTEVPANYERDQEDPVGGVDVKTNGATRIHWAAGFSAGAMGYVYGDYTVVGARKIHPWSDYNGQLYHVSWISNNDVGSRGSDYWNGGGFTFAVPNGESDANVLSNTTKNEIYVWKCWYAGDRYRDGTCDKR